MGEQVAAIGGHFARLLAPFPGRTRWLADLRHQPRCRMQHAERQWRPGHPDHRCAEDCGIGRDLAIDQRAQDQMPAHRMTGQDMGPGSGRLPCGPEMRKIRGPVGKIVHMAGHRVIAEPPRPRLSAPVGSGDAPACTMPLLQRLEILLVEVAATGKEQDRPALAAVCAGPVDPPNRVAIGQCEGGFARGRRDRAAIDGFLRRWHVGDHDLLYGYFLVSTFL